MTEAGLLQRVLMAPDLSARSDRALARAAQLATAWGSNLFVAHLVHAAEMAQRDCPTSNAPSWRYPESWSQTLEQGAPQALLEDYVSSAGVDLVVLGSQGRSGLARVLLGRGPSALTRLRHSGRGWPVRRPLICIRPLDGGRPGDRARRKITFDSMQRSIDLTPRAAAIRHVHSGSS